MRIPGKHAEYLSLSFSLGESTEVLYSVADEFHNSRWKKILNPEVMPVELESLYLCVEFTKPTDIMTHFRHQERGFSSSFSADPIEAMNAKGQANNIINAAKKSRTGNRVKVMKAIYKNTRNMINLLLC